MNSPRRLLAGLVACAACVACWGVARPATAQSPCPAGTLTFGTDATFPPFSSKVADDFVGFEIDLGDAIAADLGCRSRWINSSFDGIFPALLAGKYDMVLASVTITPERRRAMLFTDPYMNAGQAIAIRKETPPLTSIEALKGKRVGVGLNTTGQYLLEPIPEIMLNKYPSVDLALTDLRTGRMDAAVGDRPVFRYMIRENFSDLTLSGQPLNEEQWGIALAPGREALLAQVNTALARLRANGRVAALEAKHLGTADAPGAAAAGAGFRSDRFVQSIPLFVTGAKWTLILSLLSFAVAVPLGLLTALARLSRLRVLRVSTAAYVEILRGTPLLVQIFFIYFVLPAFGVALAEHVTAVLALSINASAYIGEIFRAGLESLEAGQGEAAAALGMSRAQALRYVLVPQALRRVVPPLTNECIALIKDSSLVSIMGMTELTRTGQELASRYADPLTIWPGVALTYFMLTFPLTRLSPGLEERLQPGRSPARHD